MIRAILLATTVLAATSTTLEAQRSPGALEPGDRVRTGMDDAWSEWSVVEVTPDALVLRADSVDGAAGDDRVVPLDSLPNLQVWSGSRRNAFKGLAIGTLVGAGGGFLIGMASYSPCEPEPGELFSCLLASDSRTQEGMVGAVGFGVIGGVLGLIIGAGSETDIWTPVSPAGEALSLTPMIGSNGVGVRFGLTFGGP